MQYLIIEDEALAAQRLQKMVERLLPKSQCLTILDSIENSINYFKINPLPDFIFCDVQLADGDSFTIFEQINVSCPVIFTTAYEQYAIPALRLQAVDYLLKPIKKEELENALQRIAQRKLSDKNESPQEDGKKVLTKIGNQVKVIDFQEVAYFFSQEKITFAVLPEGKKYPINYPLEQLETMLSPQQFFRANRQFIINRTAIISMQTHSKSRLRLQLQPAANEEIVVPTERTRLIKSWLVEK